MRERVLLAREALRKALSLRRKAGVSKSEPICIYDLLEEQFGIEIKFQSIKSMEGMFVLKNDRPIIVLCSERPPGRKAYTCAHEFGHYIFGHGSKLDEYFEDQPRVDSHSDPEEWLADRFASFFLMPKYAIEEAFKKRGWNWISCDPFQVYVIAGYLGVGYQTIIQHMRWSLQMLTADQTNKLIRKTPKQIRSSLLGTDKASRLIVVDRFWNNKIAVDLQIGDQVILPAHASVEGKTVKVIGKHELGILVEGQTVGTERVYLNDMSWAANIRVSRKFYVGRSLFRHLEDPDHE